MLGQHYLGQHRLGQHYLGQHHSGRCYLGRHYLGQHYSSEGTPGVRATCAAPTCMRVPANLHTDMHVYAGVYTHASAHVYANVYNIHQRWSQLKPCDLEKVSVS